MRPAIIEPAITQLVAETRDAINALREVDAVTLALEKRLGETREAAKGRRLELGMLLRKARAQLPARGTSTNGWRAYLEAIEMNESTAHRYMEEAGLVSNRTGFQVGRSEEAYDPEAPPPTDGDAPPEADEGATPADDEIEIDRDTWCTPKWITDAIGEFDLDPCANERSHVQAVKTFDLELRGEDGLVLAAEVPKRARVFINPPYSDVRPWIDAYKHTRFCFLLKVDPSTAWFAELLEHAELVFMPRRTRVQFEAPPGVPPEMSKANPFPHALFYAHGDDATASIRDLCFPPWRIK